MQEKFNNIVSEDKNYFSGRGKSDNGGDKQNGFALVSVVIAFIIISLMAVFFTNFISTESAISVDKLKGSQAYYIAEGALERALFAYNKYTTSCNALNFKGSLGAGQYETLGNLYTPSPFTELSNNITNTSTVVPVNSLTGYAPRGRIRIDSEEISYSNLSFLTSECSPFAPPCFIGVQRGVSDTIPANHSVGARVYQNQCTITSSGFIGEFKRTTQTWFNRTGATVDFYDQTGTTPIGNVETTIGTFNTTLTAGNNIIIAVVSLRNVSGRIRDIAVGNLRLKKGSATLASNLRLIRVGGNATPGTNNFPQETYIFVYYDTGSVSTPSSIFSITAIASGAGIWGEVKMVIINNAPYVKFVNGGNVNISNIFTTTIVNLSTAPFPAGDNIVIAAVQLDNNSGGTRAITGNNLRLVRTGFGILASNYFRIDLERSSRVNRGTCFLLIAKDAGAPANSTYSVTGLASNTGIIAQARLIVINGLMSAFAKTTSSILVNNTATTIVNLPTNFPPGENIVLTAAHYDNAASAQRNILSGNEYIFNKSLKVSSNAFDINLCTTANLICDDFVDGLLWRKFNSSANESFSFLAQANASGIYVNASLLVINFPMTFSSSTEY